MAQIDNPRITRLFELLQIIVFAAALFTPLGIWASRIGHFPKIHEAENRGTVPMPGFADPLSFPSRFAAHYSDQFGLRDTLLRWHALIALRWFGVSPAPDNVVIGKDGWLFLGSVEPPQYRRLVPLTDEELRTWTRALELRRAWLAARNIRYLFVVAPNKSTIYPEHYPDAYTQAPNPARLDQLLEYLKAHSQIEVLDLRPALLERKRRERVYDVTDTHWNQRGAEAAAESIAAALARWFPAIKPITRDACEEYVEDWPVGGDLTRLAAVPDAFREQALLLRLRAPRARELDASGVPWTRDVDPEWKWPHVVAVDDAQLPRAVFLADSFAERMRPFLAEHFQRGLFLFSDNFDTRLLEREHPDVVVEEMVERHLMRRPPPDPDVVDLPTL